MLYLPRRAAFRHLDATYALKSDPTFCLVVPMTRLLLYRITVDRRLHKDPDISYGSVFH